jgi:hypothetical protein
MAPSVNFQPIKVTTPDGVGIAAQLWGYPSRFEVLFVHGMLSSLMVASTRIFLGAEF